MVAAYKTGNLDPDSFIGFATITEHVVIDVLGDATKEKFGSSYDLISESLGKVNVKSSILCTVGNYKCWKFSKDKNAKIPTNYVCLGMDKYNTEILKVWIIPGHADIVREKGITIRPQSGERFSRYEIDSTIYNKVFQDMDIHDKPEFRNTTKPKINKMNLTLRKDELEYTKILEDAKNQPPSRNHIMFEFIKGAAPLQKVVLLSIVKIAQKHKLPLEYNWVINHCLNMAREHNLSYVSFRRVEESISAWSTYGVIKAKYPKIKAINADLSDIEEAILQDPEFAKLIKGDNS